MLVWQRETIYYITHTDRIEVKSAAEIQNALRSGGYSDLRSSDGEWAYSLLDGTIALNVTFTGDELSRMDAAFNFFSIPIKTISGALKQAHSVLSPYLNPPEINALCAIIAWEMPGYTSAETINYRREIGAYTLTVKGSLVTGDASVSVHGRGS